MPGLLVYLFADLTPTSAVLLSVSAFAAVSAPYHVVVDADLADFDPRPAVRRALESGRLDPLLIAVANAKFDVRTGARLVRAAACAAACAAAHASREAFRDAAALLILLTTSPKGAGS